MGANQSSQIEEFLGGKNDYMGQADVKQKRVVNATAFVEAIQQFKARNTKLFVSPSSPLMSSLSSIDSISTMNLQVIARKRPLNEKEIESGDFDVLSSGILSKNNEECIKGTIWLHKCCFRLDSKHMYVENNCYPFDRVFDEQDSTRDVFMQSLQKNIQRAINKSEGGRGKTAVIMYGATGSGKTFTMNGLFAYSAEYIFNDIVHKIASVSLYACEVSGNKVRDLFSNENITLLEDGNGVTHWQNSTSKSASSSRELVELFDTCCSSRVTKVTGVHDNSSRTHACYRVLLNFEHDGITSSDKVEIIFTDLAGSEWSRDQAMHDNARIQEAREINSSLMVIKQCIINASQTDSDNSKIPYRESKITRILKDCFVKSSNTISTLVCTTVSPSSQDTEHTLDGLSQTCRFPMAAVQSAHDGGDISLEVTGMVGSAGQNKLITTNIDSLAIVNGKGSSYVESSSADIGSSSGGSSREIGLKQVVTIEPSSNPVLWTSDQVVSWFIITSSKICSEIRLEIESGGVESLKSSYLFYEIALSAKKWVALRQEGKDSIGLSFDIDGETASSAATSGPDTSANEGPRRYLKISKVLSKGYITMCASSRPSLKPGWELVAIQGTQYNNTIEYTNALKDVLKAFKSTLAKHREHEESKVKFMTQDMKVLRDYILNGPSNTVYKKHRPQDLEKPQAVGNDSHNSDSSTTASGSISHDDTTAATVEAHVDSSTSASASSAPEPTPAPPDLVIKLRFRETTNAARTIPSIPEVPRIFTGESRLGTIWAGAELVEKYGRSPDGLAKFILACEGNERLGVRMHEELCKLI